MVDHYAVFGHPIGHTKSPEIHRLFAEQTGEPICYTAQDVPPDCFSVALSCFRAGGGKGLNCTVPLKELAFRHADEVSERAKLAGAVNTLLLEGDRIFGDNTDGIGLVRDLRDRLGLDLSRCETLIVGAGGAARGIIAPLFEAGVPTIAIVNRTASKAVHLAESFSHLGRIFGGGFDLVEGRRFDLLINATSLSLEGKVPPLPEGILREGAVCYDLMYGDGPTPFVLWGKRQGARLNVDGLGMLVEQAAEAFFLWRGVRPETGPVIEALRRARSGGCMSFSNPPEKP